MGAGGSAPSTGLCDGSSASKNTNIIDSTGADAGSGRSTPFESETTSPQVSDVLNRIGAYNIPQLLGSGGNNADVVHDRPKPFAVAQAHSMTTANCPFCKLRQKDIAVLHKELVRFENELSSLVAVIPERLHIDLKRDIADAEGLPASNYCRVEPIPTTCCETCSVLRQEVDRLHCAARVLDRKCKGHIAFLQDRAEEIERIIMEKRSVETRLHNQEPQVEGRQKDDFVTKVNHNCAPAC